MAEFIEPNDLMFTPFEPKLKNRYIMTFADVGINAYLEHINTTRYVKGKSRWQPLDITLYDPIVPSAAQQVHEWILLHHEAVTGRDGYADFYKKDITFNLLDPVGAKIEEWQLKGAYIQSANFGDLAFDASDPVEITLTLRYDYAILNF